MTKQCQFLVLPEKQYTEEEKFKMNGPQDYGGIEIQP
jgi:hypothetical protein